jgi:hypothetical protein
MSKKVDKDIDDDKKKEEKPKKVSVNQCVVLENILLRFRQ